MKKIYENKEALKFELKKLPTIHKKMLSSETLGKINNKLKKTILDDISFYTDIIEENQSLATKRALEVSAALYYLHCRPEYDKYFCAEERYRENCLFKKECLDNVEQDPFLDSSIEEETQVIPHYLSESIIIFDNPPLPLKKFLELASKTIYHSLISSGTGPIYVDKKTVSQYELGVFEKRKRYCKELEKVFLRYFKIQVS